MMRLKEEVITNPIIFAITMGITMAQSSKDEDFKVGTPSISLISVRVSLKSPFR